MPRTVVPVTVVAWEGATAPVAGTTVDQANGMYIATSETTNLLVHVKNTSAGARNAIVRQGDDPPSIQKYKGDMLANVPATNGERFIRINSMRHTKGTDAVAGTPNGSIHLDFDAGFTGTVAVYRLPVV